MLDFLEKIPNFNAWQRQRLGKMVFLCVAMVSIAGLVLLSNSLVKELARQERERMNIWAQATNRLARTDIDADFEFLLKIVSQNNSIPVMVADENYNILDFRNFELPDKHDSSETPYPELSVRNREFLSHRLHKATGGLPLSQMHDNPHFIEIKGIDTGRQYIYFEDSRLLRRLNLYPYIQIAVMLVLAIIIYVAVIYTKKAEQNRVWAGLSKETAHQLGTPISSLMAWTEYLHSMGIDPEVTTEIDKDVKRLSTIAERFSKIGSVPELRSERLNEAVYNSLDYMQKRTSRKINVIWNPCKDENVVELSRPLFEWVMENLIKNAVDAMKGSGTLTITTGRHKDRAWIEIKDTGKGIARKDFQNIFTPGFTTKKRGWGLGLTLTKRIMETYHNGKIYVKESLPGKGTTFRIELPIASDTKQI